MRILFIGKNDLFFRTARTLSPSCEIIDRYIILSPSQQVKDKLGCQWFTEMKKSFFVHTASHKELWKQGRWHQLGQGMLSSVSCTRPILGEGCPGRNADSWRLQTDSLRKPQTRSVTRNQRVCAGHWQHALSRRKTCRSPFGEKTWSATRRTIERKWWCN